jgi:hypothetical protein
MLLTSRIVRAARPRERRYVLADEHGMSLHVMPRGSKWWRFRYRFHRAERMISLGVYPDVDLATARRLHTDARGLLARDIGPSADRKEKRAANARTFEVVARQWFRLLEPRVAKGQLAADTLKDATRLLERDVFPEHVLGLVGHCNWLRDRSCGAAKRGGRHFAHPKMCFPLFLCVCSCARGLLRNTNFIFLCLALNPQTSPLSAMRGRRLR